VQVEKPLSRLEFEHEQEGHEPYGEGSFPRPKELPGESTDPDAEEENEG
jgi:hypothetical protein